ncbi:hypothetical protein JRO89_XS08G0025400 [Xanthoceras sorbifolium]|uniref:Peptidase A1 domain-containing protein n=1 Tax=Xanthoceras sorbifolium TaxID=99658 RepID=A0ABQ8HNE7_9ROSI|nr:hypothetical protein JRO89_XS08G0025400 [Xanthoceras sorbifolium]
MMMRLFFIILLLFIIQYQTSLLAFADDHQHPAKIELLHRHAPQLNARPETQLDRIKELLYIDMTRQKMISQKLHPRREACETSNQTAIEMPLRAGRDYGTGQYFVQFKVGTPAQKFTLILDTSTELTWVNCRYRCGRNCIKHNTTQPHRKVFKADLSSSFKTVPCLSQMCKVDLMNLFSLTRCPMPLNPCAYDYRYLDGSAALGIFANETVTLGLANGRKKKLKNVLIGCSDSFKGQSFANADGVVGLAHHKYSFANKASPKFGGKFSYCLVDHLSHKNVSNYLMFGGSKNESLLSGNVRYTKLELRLISPFYAVNVMGISIGGVMLKIPFTVWDAKSGGGTIIDSGTSLTFLTEPAYKPVMSALEMSVSRFERLKQDGLPMDYCFNATGFVESLVPKLVFHFADGARFEPHTKSYIIDVADGVKCLGFVPVTWPGISSIGNIMQQNHLWEFNLRESKLGFAPSICT